MSHSVHWIVFLLCSGLLPLAIQAGAPDDITVLRELQHRPGVKACTLDLAMPKVRGERPRPAIVVIHGGGWAEGDKSSFSTADKRGPANILDFAEAGFVAVTINYRMSREAPYPAALDDCRAAVRWLRANAKEYNVDAAHIGAWGNSAGGHLALLLAMQPPDKFAASEPNAAESSAVQAAVSDSGPLDLAVEHRHGTLRGVIEMFMGGPPEGARRAVYERASPVSHVPADATKQGLPPLLLIYGVLDSQVHVETSDALVASLGRAGHKDVTYLRLANVDHCPHSLIGIPYLQPVVVEFFRRTLKPADAKR